MQRSCCAESRLARRSFLSFTPSRLSAVLLEQTSCPSQGSSSRCAEACSGDQVASTGSRRPEPAHSCRAPALLLNRGQRIEPGFSPSSGTLHLQDRLGEMEVNCRYMTDGGLGLYTRRLNRLPDGMAVVRETLQRNTSLGLGDADRVATQELQFSPDRHQGLLLAN
ncbi:hypothetical protein CB1_056579101 [Camelus ferus]|nr:hypothetical protein CB1_056579101 [Camelus ferus]